MNKRKVIYVLTISVAFLLAFNVLLNILDIKQPIEPTESISKIEIEKIFNAALDHFDIDQSWIQTVNKNRKYDSLEYLYNIKLPMSTPIPVVLKDIQEEFKNSPVKISASEENINGSSSLKIASGKFVKLICNFEYDNSLVRSTSSIGLIVTDGKELNNEDLNDLLKMPFDFGVILPLEIESQKVAQTILDANKDYFILLSDDSDEVTFELNDDMNLETLIKHTQKIVSMFNSRENFFVDKNNSGFSKTTTNYIRDQFRKKNRRIIFINDFVHLISSTDEDLKSLVNFHFNKISGKENAVFIIDYENFKLIVDELNNFLKKGNKIVLPSKLLN